MHAQEPLYRSTEVAIIYYVATYLLLLIDRGIEIKQGTLCLSYFHANTVSTEFLILATMASACIAYLKACKSYSYFCIAW